MKILTKLTLATQILAATVAAQAGNVRGYFRANGTYVAPYHRTTASGNSSDKLRVVGAVYDLQTGIVSWMGAHPSQKALIAGSTKANPPDALPGEQHRDAAAIVKAEDVH